MVAMMLWRPIIPIVALLRFLCLTLPQILHPPPLHYYDTVGYLLRPVMLARRNMEAVMAMGVPMMNLD